MDGARWEQIQVLFHRAAGLPESDWRPFLETSCGEDGELIAEVLAMLKADSLETSLLDRGLPDVAYRMVGESSEPLSFRQVGPYRLKRILGEGGMGVVWLAEREDTGNLVAIKFLPHAGLSPARRGRFAREIKTLAKLKHPFIARLYDAGALDDGTPWFVMEFVEGVPFTAYCRERELPVEERLRLFRMVCEAVQYAHGQEIIHRDLKPSNILVEPDGTPRLLDFGIARQLQRLDEPADQTRPGLRFMSLDYAAPEWVRDGTVGLSTDVYSLGVILYEMLAGQLPAADQPAAVSDAAAASRIPASGKAAWSDLDVLCLKAMHKDAEQRYQSVEALIRDIDHYLKGEPLEARPDSLRYRSGKFVRRNRRSVLAASLVFLLVAGLVIFFTLRLAKERDAALTEAARTQRVEKFMTDLLEGGDEEVGPPDSLRVVTLLDRGTKEAQSLNGDPRVQADLYLTLADVYQAMGKFDQADSLLHSALKERQSIFGPDHQEVAESLFYLGVLRSEQDRLADAEGLIRKALAMDRRHLPPDHPAIARDMTALGLVLERRGHSDQAIPVLTEAARFQSTDGAPRTDLLASLTDLANAHYYLGHYTISESLNQRILAMDQQLHGGRHPDVATDFMNLGNIEDKRGRYPEAERYYRQALEINESWYGKDHPDSADMMSYIAKTLFSQGRYDEARSLLNRSLVILARVYGKDPHPRVAMALGLLGNIALARGQLDEAEVDFSKMAAIYRAVYGDAHPFTALALSNLSEVYLENKQYTRAEPLLRDVVQRFTRIASADPLNTAVARLRLGRVLLREKRYREAEPELLAGYESLAKQSSAPASSLKSARSDLVAVYDALNQPEKAKPFRAELAANESVVR